MNLNLRNKIMGAIYGFAIGDAMGATTEFMEPKQIKKKYGILQNIIGGGWLNLKAGEVTDDTQMTMCVMDAIMSKPNDIDEFKRFCSSNFISWLNSGPKDIGGMCLKSICRLGRNEVIPYDCNALGNGSLMRAMPLAILNLPFYNFAQGRLTHNNDTCSDFILGYTRLIQFYLNNDYNNNYTYQNMIKKTNLLEPTGHVENTFNNAVYWSLKDSFTKAIVGAVNHGGDADTIAAITGSLAGAKFGYYNIPKRWINQLNPDVKASLKKFAVFCFECLQI